VLRICNRLLAQRVQVATALLKLSYSPATRRRNSSNRGELTWRRVLVFARRNWVSSIARRILNQGTRFRFLASPAQCSALINHLEGPTATSARRSGSRARIVMKIMVSLAESEQCNHPIVARRVRRRVGAGADDVRQGINAKSQVVADDEPQNACEQDHPTMLPNAQPAAAAGRHSCDGKRQVMPMLKCHERVFLQFAHVLQIGVAARVVAEHPAMCENQKPRRAQ